MSGEHRSVTPMLKAYIGGVAALRTKKELAYKVLGRYMGGDFILEAYEYGWQVSGSGCAGGTGSDSMLLERLADIVWNPGGEHEAI
ncbi:MAG: hypothetical protein WCH75_04395 [Candidatus Binatia bacterium]